MPAEGMERQEYLRRKFGDHAGGNMYEAVKEAGRGEGIPFHFERIRRTPNTLLAHRLIAFARREKRQDVIVEALFQGYFTAGADIGRIDTLTEIAASAGFEPDRIRAYLESDEDLADIKAEDQFARQIGIQGVPCFIIDRKFALSGAQPPEAFLEVFELAKKEASETEASAEIV
jgi:predicted DsbA family dithiol-disulfide isomerase